MIRANRILINLLVLFGCGVSAAQVSAAEAVQKEAVERPKIAVVLAGGGAKGAAHIGVLKALEEMHIPVDLITGTSMGAYVGGLYAAGMSADEIESLIYSIEWNDGYKDRVSRGERRIRDKAYEDYYQLNTDMGLGWGEIRSPKGVVQGQNMMRILRESSGNIPKLDSFDDLPVPFRSVATDIVNLKEVVLDKGLITDAMMASMSVPGALPPYELDGVLLVDGGVTNNMPVDVAREMGADIIIAADISTEYLKQEDVGSFVDVGNQISNYLVRRTTDEQAELLTEKDVLLVPAVGQMETTEFDRMPQAYLWGYESAQKNVNALARYSVSSAEYQRYIDEKEERRREVEYGDELVVSDIVLNNNSHYKDDILLEYLNLTPGKSISTEELEKSISKVYALDKFQRIFYHFEKDQNDETLLFIDINEKEWGPNYVNFRFFLEEDFTSDSQYGLGVSTNFTGLNSLGAELKVNLELGTDRLASVSWYSPFFTSQKLFNSFDVIYRKDEKSTTVEGLTGDTSLAMSENSLSTTYTEFELEGAVGIQPTFWQEARVGGRYIEGDVSLTSLPAYGQLDYIRKGLFVGYTLDTLDDFSLPTEGVRFNAEYFVSDDSVSGSETVGEGVASSTTDFEDDLVHEFDLMLRGAYSFGDNTLVGHVEYGTVEDKSDDNPAIQPKELGGFLRLSGIPRNSINGQNLFFSSLVYRYRWFENDFGLFTAPVYLGASLEYGGVWSDTDLSLGDAPLYRAGSLFAGISSPVGPIVLALGATEEGHESIYLIVGQSF
ncbi:patatin-like phospholipase family protein [Vibrio sp. JC009]|uniref:patatin-like phospholipase family protein n=1 Tax=Vibrio sp. JC009 TaxID=2912314 RepID=UPI0023B17471|nr:patatin-like phospholipase family protein [Vibrio sp. JC009]WED22377.1 patatin-like phospholipase family protein [Vibrio sp. JC009]